MNRPALIFALAMARLCIWITHAGAQNSGIAMRFAVSGDSRDCGDVVMPAIAIKALAQQPAFYWHLGDFRKIYDFDEDMQHEPE
ncbi:MAG: hypothetical protein WAK91_04955, partial [Candidatus Acidiferrales bacterium]